MGKTTEISWCDSTMNPWIGCTKVSPGCANCYAETLRHRWGKDEWGKGKPRTRTSAAYWRQPVKWNSGAADRIRCEECDGGAHGRRTIDVCGERLCVGCGAQVVPPGRPRVFCGSLCDWLDDEVPVQWLADLLGLIAATPHLDWLLLTKRPENWRRRLSEVVRIDNHCNVEGFKLAHGWLAGTPPPNVWLGVSVEDQRRADERIPALLAIPAAVHWLSVEPQLEHVTLPADFLALGKRAWCIVGGESGPGARPFDLAWARALVRQCKNAGLACFVKQLGARPSVVEGSVDAVEWCGTGATAVMDDCGRIHTRDNKGGDPAEWPADLRVRQWPEVAP